MGKLSHIPCTSLWLGKERYHDVGSSGVSARSERAARAVDADPAAVRASRDCGAVPPPLARATRKSIDGVERVNEARQELAELAEFEGRKRGVDAPFDRLEPLAPGGKRL